MPLWSGEVARGGGCLPRDCTPVESDIEVKGEGCTIATCEDEKGEVENHCAAPNLSRDVVDVKKGDKLVEFDDEVCGIDCVGEADSGIKSRVGQADKIEEDCCFEIKLNEISIAMIAILPKDVGTVAVWSFIRGTAACGRVVTLVTQSCCWSKAASASIISFSPLL